MKRKGAKLQTAVVAVRLAAGAGFRSLTEAIDTTTPAGRTMMRMVGSFAECERAMIRERTSAGLAQPRLEGRVGGRRPKLTKDQRDDVIQNVFVRATDICPNGPTLQSE